MSPLDDSDPTGWPDERLELHSLEWCGLPLMPRITHSMDDSDVDFHSDYLYLRGLLAEIQDVCIRDGGTVSPLPSSSALDVVLREVKDWPIDRAGVLLKAWRGDTEEQAA